MSALFSPPVSVAVFLFALVCLPNSLSSPTQCSKCDTLLGKLVNLLQSYMEPESSRVNATEASFVCDGQVVTASGGRISYQGNGRYGDEKRCEWRIQAPAFKVIQIKVEQISKEGHNCNWDQLDIIDVQDRNSKLFQTNLCRVNLLPEAITSKGCEVLVRLITEDGLGRGGFQLKYSYLSKQEQDQRQYESCTGVNVMVGSFGHIRFPVSNHPAKNLKCLWRIIGPLGTQIQVKVLWLNITKLPAADGRCESGCCQGESLVIRDGDSASARTIATFCEISAYFPSAVTSNNSAVVELTSENGAALELNYRTLSKERRVANPVCEGQVIDVTGSGGIIQSPDYGSGSYPENARCRWRINAGPGKRVRFIFKELDIERDKTCRSDSLALYNGFEATDSTPASAVLSSSSTQIIGRYCGSTIPESCTSLGPDISIVFESDDTVEGRGFSLQWTIVPMNVSEPITTVSTYESPSCNGRPTDLTSNEGVIYSPTSANELNYPFNMECTWRVTVASGMRVVLHFERFSLETPTGKECYDAVAIFDGPDDSADSMGLYCGSDIPPDVTTTSNSLFVYFISDKSLASTGFLARYSAVAEPSTTTQSMMAPRSVSCGVPEVMPLVYTRIVGGVEAIPYSWPWQASVRYKPRHGEHWCGGAIISSFWIITAAHCVYYYGNASNFRVVVGDHNQAVFEGAEVTLNVAKVVIHPEYHPDTNDHDLALLQLSTEISFGRTAKPVCICDDEIPDGTLCIVTGWGDTRINGSTGKSNVLNQLHVPIIKQEVCNQQGWYNGDLTETMLCAGFPDGLKDSCQGDSGGPLVRLVEGRWRLIGITSWGFDCAQPNHPGIYTRMLLFSDWVRQLTGASCT